MKSLRFGPGLSLFMINDVDTPLTYNSVCIKCHTSQPLARLLDQKFFFIYLFIYFYTGPILIAVFITEMVILFKHVIIIIFFLFVTISFVILLFLPTNCYLI